MTYSYHCTPCGLTFDVIKRVSEMDAEETCEKCKLVAERVFNPKIYLSGTKVQEAAYNPGLGCVVRNENHKREIMKQRNLIEIGSEKPETIHKHYDNERKDRWEKSWNDADRGWVGNGE